MRIPVFCRRILCCLMICFLLIPASLADSVDLSSFTDDEIETLLTKINEELVARGIPKSATLPAGKYIGGMDLPAGAYIITCRTDDSHHGIVWVSAATDDLENEYPSILYEHVSFSTEEQYRITIEDGSILSLPFTATLTISSRVLFK